MTKVEKVLVSDRYSYNIKITKDGELPFIVPVLDVRDGPEVRETTERFLKDSNALKGSKFIKPSYSLFLYSYNESMRRRRLGSN